MSDPHADAANPDSLEDAARKIHDAHEAEENLLHTMPNAIHPDDEDHPGMTAPSASEDEQQENREEQPEPGAEDDDRT